MHRLLTHRLELTFKQGDSEVVVELRASDDGFAYRTSLTGPARTRVTGECSAFTAPGAQAWLQRFNRAYEAPYTPTLLRDALPGPIAFPALLRTGARLDAAERERRRHGPARRRAWRSGPGIPDVLFVARPHAQPGLQLVRTPWRVAVDRPARDDRRVRPRRRPRPARAAADDWSWVRPGRVAWSWWSDSASPASLAAQQAYVDFAAQHGLGVRARRRGLGPGVDPAARRLRPRAAT